MYSGTNEDEPTVGQAEKNIDIFIFWKEFCVKNKQAVGLSVKQDINISGTLWDFDWINLLLFSLLFSSDTVDN